jgi:Kef-type K+ transport system membrane component KefB
MTPFLQLAFELVVILLAAKAAGYLITRLGQPSVLGELLVGVLLGPSLIDILHLSFINSGTLETTISELSELGVLMLMFLAGLELHLGELTSNRKISFLASLGGLLLSIGLGWSAGRLFELSNTSALLLGLAMAATSVSISARTLMEMGVLRSRVGLSLLGAAVVDDVLSILAFSIFLAVASGTGGFLGLLLLVVRMALFLSLATAFGLWVLPFLVRRVARLSISQGVLAFAIVTLLAYGLAAELVGQMAALIGVFLAGLMFARTPEKAHIEQGMTALAYGLFVPIFFIDIGLSVDLRVLQWNSVWLILVLTVAAVGGKLIGAAGGARLGGLPMHESVQLGVGMVARGEVTLIIAAAGSLAGLLDGRAFSAIVAAVLLSTLATPPMLRLAFTHLKQKESVPVVDHDSQKEEQKK